MDTIGAEEKGMEWGFEAGDKKATRRESTCPEGN